MRRPTGVRAADLALGDYRGPARLGPLLRYARARLDEMDVRDAYRDYLGLAIDALAQRKHLTKSWGELSGWRGEPVRVEPGSVVKRLRERGAFG